MGKKYLSEIEELMQEWDWKANVGLDSSGITCGSQKKFGGNAPNVGMLGKRK